MRLRDKVAIITGGGSGIGKGIALRFAEEGCGVVLCDIDVDSGRRVEAEIEEAGGRAHFVACDVSVESDVRALVVAALERFGKVDILVNNAFYRRAQGDDALGLTNEVWQKSLDVIVTGAWWCSKYALEPMLRQGHGVIINISSRLGLLASPKSFAYCVAKAGLIQMARSIAVDFGREGIRACAICPGMVETPATEQALRDPEKRKASADKRFIERFAVPRDVANAALFLASDEASYIQGEALVIDGGAAIV